MRFLATEELTVEEFEAVRLKHAENLDQTAAAKRMRTSQSTFQRILDSANKKIGRALAEGKAIKINQDQLLSER